MGAIFKNVACYLWFKEIDENKIKTSACSGKNGRGKPTKLLKMGLESIKMSWKRNMESIREKITTYREKRNQKKSKDRGRLSTTDSSS